MISRKVRKHKLQSTTVYLPLFKIKQSANNMKPIDSQLTETEQEKVGSKEYSENQK